MNFKYLTCYRRNGDKITIYQNDGHKYEAQIRKHDYINNKFLNFDGMANYFLFSEFGINKHVLTEKLPFKYYSGDWPECKDEKGVLALLNLLIKETKRMYLLKTEL